MNNENRNKQKEKAQHLRQKTTTQQKHKQF